MEGHRTSSLDAKSEESAGTYQATCGKKDRQSKEQDLAAGLQSGLVGLSAVTSETGGDTGTRPWPP